MSTSGRNHVTSYFGLRIKRLCSSGIPATSIVLLNRCEWVAAHTLGPREKEMTQRKLKILHSHIIDVVEDFAGIPKTCFCLNTIKI